MAETTADVRRDIELTRDRISNTLNQLEQKVQVTQVIKDHPWPAIGLALGAGFLLSGSKVDVKAAATTVAATKGASSKLGNVLDDMVSNLMGGLSAAFEDRVESLVNELKGAIGAPTSGRGSSAMGGSSSSTRSNFASGPVVSSAGSQSMSSPAGAGSSGMSAGASTDSGMSGSGFGASSGTTGSVTSASGYQSPRAD